MTARSAADWAGVDDRIAALIRDDDTPAQRRSTAISVAVGRAAGVDGAAYGALISTANNWWPRAGRADTPEGTAAFIREHFDWEAASLAELADAVAEHIEATAADLRDDGATAAAWRRYARELRR